MHEVTPAQASTVIVQKTQSSPAPASKVEGVRQPHTSEAPKEVTPAAPAQDEQAKKYAERDALFARKEKAIRSEWQKIKAQQAEMATKAKEYESQYIPKDRLSKEPLKVLSENGLTYDQLTNMMLNQPGDNPEIQALRKEVSDLLNNQKTEYQKNQELQQQQAYDQAVNQIRKDATTLVDTSPEFEVIKQMGQVESVVELIQETFNQTGEILDVEHAAKQVEDYLVETGLKIASFNKIKAKLTPAQAVAEATKPAVQQKPHVGSRTLTSTATTTSKPRLTENERRDRAILAAQGKLY